MSEANTHENVGTMKATQFPDDARDDGSGHQGRTALNWTLAALTVPGAVIIVAFEYIQVLGTAGCSEHTCGPLGPGPFVFGLIEYGAPLVAIVCVALSFIAARRRYGTLVPLIAWAILVSAFAVLNFSFQIP